MSVRRQLLLVRWATVSACVGALFLLLKFAAQSALVWIFAIGFLALARPLQRRAERLVTRRAFARLRRLIVGEAFDEANAQLENLRTVYARAPAMPETLRLQEAFMLEQQRRYPEAIRMFDSLDRRRFSKEALGWLMNGLAISLTMSGDGARAVTVAREAIDAGAAGSRELELSQLGALGMALVVAGRPEDAIEPLERALAADRTPQFVVGCAYYLGEALQSLGRHDEAREAWKRAADACPDDALGQRARERLEAPAPPYRS